MKNNEIGWSIAEGMHDGRPVVIRFRNVDQSFPRGQYPQRLNIFWTFDAPTTKGLPSSDDSSRVRLFEDRLIDAVESDVHSILTMVLTGKGMREFVFQTPDVKEFLQRFSKMPQEKEKYPVEIHHHEDAGWDCVKRVLGDIQK